MSLMNLSCHETGREWGDMEYTKYNIKLYFVELPEDSIRGAVSKDEDGSYSIFINKALPVRLQEVAILHELAHLRLNHLESKQDTDQLEAELRKEYWWHDYYRREEEEMSKNLRLRNAQEEYKKKFGKTNGITGKFFSHDLEEIRSVLDREGLFEALLLALEAGFMIGYRRKTYEVLNPLKD